MNINHKTSSPYHSQSYGLVERTIQTVKNILKKCKMSKTDPYLALLELRNTPLSDNLPSAAQLLYNRQIKSILPVTNNILKPIPIRTQKIKNIFKDKQKQQKFYYDQHAKYLPNHKFTPGQKIFVKTGNKNIPGKILSKNVRPRSYDIKLASSQKPIVRNRKFIINKHAKFKKDYHSFYRLDSDDEGSISDDGNNSYSSTNEANICRTPLQTRFGRNVKQPQRFQVAW